MMVNPGLSAAPVPVSDAIAASKCDSFTCASPGVINSGGFSVLTDLGGGQLGYVLVSSSIPSAGILQPLGLVMPSAQIPCAGPSVPPLATPGGSTTPYAPGMCDNPNAQLHLTQSQTVALMAALSGSNLAAGSAGSSGIGLSSNTLLIVAAVGVGLFFLMGSSKS
jgi:hypothetical protein